MTFQSTVATDMAFGVPGELFLDGPFRGDPGIIDSAGPNTIGYAFTNVAGSAGHVTVGGTGVFAGLLANPKEYALYGSGAAPLAPTLDLPQYANGAFVHMGALIVALANAGNIGDTVDYDNTTGALYARAASYPSSGAQRVANVAATGVATVTLTPAGAPPIGVGSVIRAADGQTLTVTQVLTGTGGNGTYATTGGQADHAAQAFSFSSVPVAGRTNIENSEIIRYNNSAAGLAVVQLTK